MIIYNRTEYKALTPQQYKKEKKRLQVELLKFQEWVINKNKRIAIALEGRDAAGKGSTIKRYIENGKILSISEVDNVLRRGLPDIKKKE